MYWGGLTTLLNQTYGFLFSTHSATCTSTRLDLYKAKKKRWEKKLWTDTASLSLSSWLFPPFLPIFSRLSLKISSSITQEVAQSINVVRMTGRLAPHLSRVHQVHDPLHCLNLSSPPPSWHPHPFNLDTNATTSPSNTPASPPPMSHRSLLLDYFHGLRSNHSITNRDIQRYIWHKPIQFS